jgi:hypothetical protein
MNAGDGRTVWLALPANRDEFGARPPSLLAEEAFVAAGAVVFVVHGDAQIVVGRLIDARPDVALVDALARLQLAARRLGCAIRLGEVSSDLRGLLVLTGLAECLGVEPRRETEGRE